ncbi:MAG: bifunctional [glutamate--ammonia ligase]-adenylyl-L-tyrosine phosphorylase/[glutamate--ammonia-ligase] adenylyltransferase [Desulfobacteraceae bacterium]|nr:bifunctional [glutamate--ammonia ligase]-adenylyl-L-tyrosine phosphorylase/[glutamate--ammonia-ligase] adenylyltransferase [Desulfobacteraceae bacterium]MBC2755579.1 bifunctional [glutamate--ammonia ligase]-adenylyl-L-tyrosine phosphorylase/[glutamate--ammonia-ligase] adenylyltransferase [Desulfobacteraceae bacterium]
MEKWAAFAKACEKSTLALPGEAEVDEADVFETAKKVFVFSEFVAKRCARNPEMFLNLIATGDLARSYDIAEYAGKITENCRVADDFETLSVMIRRTRTREMVRIAFRDLAGWSDLPETMNEITGLADACLEGALSRLYQWMIEEHGTPVGKSGKQQRLAVIGFGKLGGRELNFSSDVDLMFVFPEAGKTQGREKPISNEEFFARLCHRLIDVIGKNMTEGFVFRVDARLRPYGESGPIVMSFEAMESYYQEQGRDWERYALIKARVVAGDKSLGRVLLGRLKPFVYRRYLDYGIFESLRGMKRKIEREVIQRGIKANIKLGPGGIREVEFFGQIFQLIRGGVNIDYQKRSILVILQTLANDNNIPESVKDELTEAYVFLRYIENRLQMFDDRQTHSLPEDLRGKCRLALSMGFTDWQGFSESLDAHMGKVHNHFSALLLRDDSEIRIDEQMIRINDVWINLSNIETNLELLKKIGFDPPDDALLVLQNFLEIIKSSEVSLQGSKRVNLLVPHIMKESAASENPVRVLRRIFELIKAIRGRSCYVSLLIENTDVLIHLVKLAEASPWIMSFLSCHPLLLDELLDPRTLYAPVEKEDLKEEIKLRFDRLPEADLESQMDGLRIFKQINILRICAADVAGLMPLMRVSDRLTNLAESILDRVMDMAWDHMVEKYGVPSGVIDFDQKGFGIIAYGKLGGYELGYVSDLDLVFLHTGEKGYTQGGLQKPVDNAQFYVRLGQRIIHLMTAMTQTGKLYETDMRLRPSGSAGILVTHIDGFEEYQKKRAWTWEHQAIIKARAITGDVHVRERFEKIREEILSMKREESKLREGICDMRTRMRAQQTVPSGEHFDIKNDPGGIVDIEFMVQFLVLLNASLFPSLIKWTDVVRQLNSLALAGIFDDKTAYILKQAYLVFRFYNHRLTLQERPAVLSEDQFIEIRDQVKQIWKQYLG